MDTLGITGLTMFIIRLLIPCLGWEFLEQKDVGVASVMAGIAVALVGFFVYILDSVCFVECYRPNEALGLMVIGFGMALFVLGIALIATARTKAT